MTKTKNRFRFIIGSVIFMVFFLFLLYKFNRPKIEKEYYSSGEEKTVFTTINGYKQGEYLNYFESGKLKEKSNYLNDHLNGKKVEYFESGQEKIISNYSKGELHDKKIAYFSNGKVSYTGVLDRGARVGVHGWYYQDGGIARIIEYDDYGFEKSYSTYLENGDLDSVRTPYVIPFVAEDNDAKDGFYARILLANQKYDSCIFELKVNLKDNLFVRDSLLEPVEINSRYAEYFIPPSKDGQYVIEGSITEYESKSNYFKYLITFKKKFEY